ncbi:MAG: cysteine hydrolase [Dehalococcoidia bacterium]|nr:cysteine hydrolase [Dehalococcoidia bacterium]
MPKTAVIVVDMLKDTLDVGCRFSIGEEGRKIIPNVQRLLAAAREKGLPVIFANDSFLPDDFMFREMKRAPHCVMGTEGAEVIAELGPQKTDIILPKRRMSAFMGTNLDRMLQSMDVDTIAVAGISTPVCVLTTVLDGVAHDFRAILLEDCCAAYRRPDHEAIIKVYGKGAMYPLLQAMPLEKFLSMITPGSG